jgi:endoglucanase
MLKARMSALVVFCVGWFVATGALATELPTPPAELPNGFSLGRGVNVSHWLSQSQLRGAARERYVTEEDFRRIAELGFDHVRLPFDEEQLWDEHGARQEDAFALLHRAIQWSLAHGLKVVADLHVLRAHHFNRPDSRRLWEDPAAQAQFLESWQQLSAELGQYPVQHLAYEPLNEAVADDPDEWNRLINRVIAELRRLEPERAIVMGSNRWQQVFTFAELQLPENDPNIILSFHYYSPFVLTHYRASWTDIRDYAGPVHYPGRTVAAQDLEGLPVSLRDSLAVHHDDWSAELMERQILLAVAVARQHGLPLYCGEFGAFPSTPLNLRQHWYRDLAGIFQKHGIAWAHWNWKNDFPLVSADGVPDRALLDSLLGQ